MNVRFFGINGIDKLIPYVSMIKIYIFKVYFVYFYTNGMVIFIVNLS